jgi:peptide/nickel transport system substrate-binding protein
MRTKSLAVRLILGVLGLILASASCGGPSPSSSGATESGPVPSSGATERTLVIASAATPPGVDFDLYAGPQTWDIVSQTYDTLTHWKERPLEGVPGAFVEDIKNIDPGLAESWEVSPDGKTMTMHLALGITSNYGNELTAEDVKWSVDRAFGTEGFGAFLQTAQGITSSDQVKVVDKYTIRFDVPRPAPLKLMAMASAYGGAPFDSKEAKKHATAEDPWAIKWLATNTAGFGPYFIQEWSPGQQVVLGANPNWWGPTLPYSKVIYKEIPEAANRLALLLAGDADIAQALTPTQLSDIKDKSDISVLSIPGNRWIYIRPNYDIPPLDNPKVRQALNYAVPRDEITTDVFRGFGRPLKSVIGSVYPGYTDKYFDYEYNLDKARSLLQEAGVDSLSLTISFNNSITGLDTIAQVLKTNWEKLGLTVNIDSTPSGTFETQIQKHAYQMPLTIELFIVPDPLYGEALFLGSPEGAGVLNYGNYRNSQVAEALKDWPFTPEGERIPLAEEVQRITVQEDPAYIFIVEPGYQLGVRSNISHVVWNVLSSYYVARLEVAE